jgi:hypothetical protein
MASDDPSACAASANRPFLCRTQSSVNFPVLPEPIKVTALSVLVNFSKEVDGLRFVARLARIIGWNNHLDFNGHDIFFSLNKPLSLQSFPGNSHSSSLIKEVNGNKFGHIALPKMRPDGLELRSVRQRFTNLNHWIGPRSRSFFEQFASRHARNSLPFHNTPVFKPFSRVLTDYVFFFGHEHSNRLKKLTHKPAEFPEI